MAKEKFTYMIFGMVSSDLPPVYLGRDDDYDKAVDLATRLLREYKFAEIAVHKTSDEITIVTTRATAMKRNYLNN